MKEIYRIFFSALACGLEGRELPCEIKEAITPEILQRLYALAKAHDMAHIVAKPLGSLKLEGCAEIMAKLSKQEMLAIFRCEQLRYELGRIKETLGNAEIDFIALKGSTVRDFYREAYFRTSCDIDILVHEEELEKAIGVLTEVIGYKVHGEKSYHDISLFSESGVHLELHFNICEKQENLDRLLSQVWDYAERAGEDSHEYLLSNEYLLFHLIAHAAYHFASGGCGVKPIMDLWVLEEKLGYDREKLSALCAECGLEKFRTELLRLSRIWFANEEGDSLSDEIEDYILKAGVYGKTENKVAVEQSKESSKFAYLMRRIFIPYDDLKYYYPILQKHKWLLPAMEVRRWFRVVFCGGLGRSVKELKTGISMSDEKSGRIVSLMKDVGL